MARNKLFHSPSHEPFNSDPSLELDNKHTKGVFSFLNPTHAQFHPTDASAAQSISYSWRSRDNRKGRHTLLIPKSSSSANSNTGSASNSNASNTPPSTQSVHSILHTLYLMLTYYPYWDISWLIAVLFTLGSIIWVINAFFVWLPLVDPWTEFPGEISVAGGWTAFVGATVFEIGSVLLVLEAVNENREGCFGWALEKVVEGAEQRWRVRPEKRGCGHHHANRGNLVGKALPATATLSTRDASSSPPASETKGSPQDENSSGGVARSWQWLPSWHDLTTHYLHELGFLACAAQLFGASIFWISGFTAIPQIQSQLPTQAALNGAYWLPQIVGGSGFIVSGLLFMLETQRKWYIPALGTLGWHIGAWNLIGALGFTLCGALGPAYASPAAQFQASLATFWGSWAFLVASVVQWYEGLDKFPVEVVGDQSLGSADEGGKE